MPTKTLYVKQENVQIFEKAEKLTNSVSDLIADLLRDYVTKEEHKGNIYAVCYVDTTADGIPTFVPEFFVKAPYDVDFRTVKDVVNLSSKYDTHNLYFYPLGGLGGEFEEQLTEDLSSGEIPIVPLEEF